MIIRKLMKRKKTCLSVALTMLVLASSFGLFGGCGADYETPASLTETPTSLITAADLKGWMDAGLVNSSGYNNVVILDISSSNAAYLLEHLSGSYYVSTGEVTATRSEGVGVSTQFMVPDGEAMDALIQRTGIGPNTTIVLTSQQNVQRSTMAYFAFRYWGFPKNRLKVLDKLMANWKIDAPGISTDISGVAQPAVNSSYSVRQNAALRADLRISFPEMIDIAEGKVPNAVILQAAVPVSFASFNTGILGSVDFPYIPQVAATATLFQSAATISANLTLVGVDSTKYTVVYCNSGYLAVPVYFALDGILGWPVYYYDGGWLQWGQMIDENQAVAPAVAVGLDANSRWRTDIPTRSKGIPPTYAAPAVWVLPFVSPVSFDASVNEIEEEDADYMNNSSGGGSGGGGTPGC